MPVNGRWNPMGFAFSLNYQDVNDDSLSSLIKLGNPVQTEAQQSMKAFHS